jgi:Mor family transcriptional regulator
MNSQIYIEEPPKGIPDNEHLRSYRVLIAGLKQELAEKEKLINRLEGQWVYDEKVSKHYEQSPSRVYESTMDGNAMLSPIKRRDLDSTVYERLAYYHSRDYYLPKITPIRELYKESIEDDKSVVKNRGAKSYSELKEEIELTKEKVDKILENLRYYKRECESFLESAKDYQKPKEHRMICTEDQIQECIAQCQALGRQIDLLQEKYSRMLNAPPYTQDYPKYKVTYRIMLRRM